MSYQELNYVSENLLSYPQKPPNTQNSSGGLQPQTPSCLFQVFCQTVNHIPDYAQVLSILVPLVLYTGAFYATRNIHRCLLYPANYTQAPAMPRVLYTGAFYTLHTIHRCLLYPAYYTQVPSIPGVLYTGAFYAPRRDTNSPEFPEILPNFYRCFRSPEFIYESPGFDTFLIFYQTR